MSTILLEALRRDAQAFMEEISRETYLAHSGHKATAELQPIYDRHAGAMDRNAFDYALDAFKSATPPSIEHRAARTLLEWELEAQASRALAPLDEREIAWESSAVIRLPDGREIQYQAAPIEIGNAKDRAQRLAIDDARAALVRDDHSPLRLEILQREKETIESMNVAASYNESFEAVTGISLNGLASQCEQFLRDTQAMWDETLRGYLRSVLGITPKEARRADALALFRASEFDDAFPAREMESAVRRQVTELGIDPGAGERIRYDIGEREGKSARAFCAPVRVPDEVYLVLRPHGGQNDYNALLHELGHALHFAYASPDLPFEFRWLGDNSVTESYAMLFDHRMQDAGWLARYTQLGKNRVGEFLRRAGFEELHFLRRYCAKLIYEIALYGGDVPWSSLPDLYVSKLSEATGFEYRPVDAFIDIDPRFYSARYLRAWQLQSGLNEYLTGRFDFDWHRNPAAGPWIVGDLFAAGQRDTADEIADRIGTKLSFAALVRKIEALLES